MGRRIQPNREREAWALAHGQHGVIARSQLLELGFSRSAIQHRIATGRLHPLSRGVYAVGRPAVTRRGRWMAAVLSSGPDAVLSHANAAALWGIRPEDGKRIEVSVPDRNDRRRPGVVVHRPTRLPPRDRTVKDGIPVTTPIRTLVDLATRMQVSQLEAAINEANKRDLIDPETLRAAMDAMAGVRGASRLRSLLDRRTFALTDSELERLFLPLARQAGLPAPLTQQRVNGFRVDFYWPELGLVVETDGLRYHRTPAQQARDRLRDHAHLAAGLTPVRFTHAQVRFERAYVGTTLRAVVANRRLVLGGRQG
jgi:very-short-patch-repair endonuclease/predicted transcriptional regulator of viral defense system